MRKKVFVSIVFLVTMLFAVVGWAADWFVRPAGGDYGNEDGTSYENAWDGFENIDWSKIQPGDTLWLAGHFNITKASERLIVDSSGITVRGDYPTDLALITAIRTTVPSEEWIDNGNGVYTYTITRQVTSLWEDGENIDKASSSSLDDGNWYSEYSTENGTSTIYYKPSSGTASDHEVTVCTSYWAIEVYDKSNVIIKDISFSYGDVGIRFGSSGGGHIVQGCSFAYERIGVQIADQSSDGVVVQSCFFKKCGCGAYFYPGNTNFNIVRNCKFYDIAYSWNPRNDGHGVGIQKCGVLVENNYFNYGSRPIGIWGDSSTQATNVIIRCNYIKNCDSTKTYPNPSGIALAEYVDGASISYNFIENCNRGIRVYGDRNETCIISNNTILDCSEYGIHTTSTADKVHFFNNIVYSCGTLVRVDNASASDIMFNYNCYYPDGSAKFSFNESNYDFSEWQSVCSWDSNSFVSNPLLTSNYHLSRNSPCIDAGIKLPIHDSNWRDLAGNTQRYGSAPDIGCYEYNSDLDARWGRRHRWMFGRWGVGRWKKNRWMPYE